MAYGRDGLCWNEDVDEDGVYWRDHFPHDGDGTEYGTWFDPDFDKRDYGDNVWWGFETREDCEADVRRFVDFGLYRLACCLVCIPQLITGLGLIITLCRTGGAKVAATTGATTADAADGAGTAPAAGTAQLESDLAAARDALKERDRQLEQARADADELRKEVAQAQAERDEARLEAQLRDTPRHATAVSVVPGGTAPAQLATVLSVRHL